MLLPGRNVGILIAVIIVLTSCIVANAGDDSNTININLGFDLVHGENGNPTLRVGNLEEIRPRAAAADDSSGDSAVKNRDESDENEDNNKSDGKPTKASSSGSDENESDNDDATTISDRITRGLIMDEKELHPKSRGGKKEDADDDDDDDE